MDKFAHVPAHYLELRGAVTGYSIYGDRLWLETGDGQALVFWHTSDGLSPYSSWR